MLGAVDRGCASTTYEIPSSDTYEGGRGPDRVLGLISERSTFSLRCQNRRSGSTRCKLLDDNYDFIPRESKLTTVSRQRP